MKKYRCGKCGEIFVGKLEICPKCGTELHYLDQEVKKESETVKQGPKFHYEDEDVLKGGIKEEELLDKTETPSVAQAQAPATVDNRTKRVLTEESYFDGRPIQLLGWRLLGLLLFVVTLTIGFPWASCMVYRWQTKHTVIGGYRLKFDGKGGQLFGRYLLWLLLMILTVGIYSFWFMNNLKKWKIKHTIFADTQEK